NEHRNTSSLFFFKVPLYLKPQNRLKPTSDKALPAFGNYLVDNTILLRLVCGHDVVAFDVLFNPLQCLSGMVCKNFIHNCSNAQTLSGMNIDVGRLALQAAHPGLVDEDPRMRQREALLRCSCCQEYGRHARGLTDANRRYVVSNKLNRVVNSQSCRNGAARTVDV